MTVNLQRPITGPVYKEQMCLIQATDSDYELTLSTGRLCVSDFPFVHAQDYRIAVDGTEVGGVIGLGPHDGEGNFVRKLVE